MSDFVTACQHAAAGVTDCDGFIVALYQEDPKCPDVGIVTSYGLGLRRQAVESERLEGKMKLMHALGDILAHDDELLSSLCVVLCLQGKGQDTVLKLREVLATPGADGRKAGML